MIENYRLGLLWRLMRDCPYVVGIAASGIHRRLVMTCVTPIFVGASNPLDHRKLRRLPP